MGVMYTLQGISERDVGGKLGERTRGDLEKICRMGYNTVYLFDIHRDPDFGATYSPLWYAEDAPGRMEPLSHDPADRDGFEGAYGAVYEIALSLGMRVIPSLCYNLPAQWLWENRDAIKRRADGSLHHTVYYHECFRNEKVLKYTRGRLERLMGTYAGDDNFRSALALFRIDRDDAVLDDSGRPLFVIHNDTLDRGFCYCRACREAWGRDYLPRLYGDVGSFNELHGTDHSSLDQIPMPFDRSDVRLWYELSDFFTEGLMAWVREVGETIRRYIPEAMLSLVLKYPRSGYALQYPDWSRVCELCDLIFMDPYPMEGGSRWNIEGYAFDIETYRSLSMLMGKPLVPQFQLSSSYSEIGMAPVKTPTEDEVLQQFYVAVGRGARGFVSWAFPPALDDGSGKIMDGEAMVHAVARILGEARQLFEASEGTRETYGQVMLPYNYPSVIRARGEFEELFSLYRFFSGIGLAANPAYMNLLGSEDIHRYDGIAGFKSLGYTKAENAMDLIRWLGEGGRVLCGENSLRLDELGEELGLDQLEGPRVGRGYLERATTGDSVEGTGLKSSLQKFAGDLPAGPVRISCSSGEVVYSWRRGEGRAIFFIVNACSERTRVELELDNSIAMEGSPVFDVVTGSACTCHYTDGVFHLPVDLGPFESRALSVGKRADDRDSDIGKS